MDLNHIITLITIYAVPLIFAITLHEAAHAYAARYFGDATAYMLGRMTLNPFKHIDPIWTILVPVVLLLIKSPFIFGAAKPVPVNFCRVTQSQERFDLGRRCGADGKSRHDDRLGSAGGDSSNPGQIAARHFPAVGRRGGYPGECNTDDL